MKKAVMFLWRLILDLLFPEGPVTEAARAATPAYLQKTALRAGDDAILRALGAVAVFRYRDPLVRETVRLLKYRGDVHVAAMLAETLYEPLLAALADTSLYMKNEQVLIAPIPLHPRRERERGFNQCERLGEALALRAPQSFQCVPRTLARRKETQSQTALSREERLKNVAGCFAVTEPSNVRGKVIVIVDDVITTGATMRDATRALREAGARAVIPLAIAH